MSVRPCIHKHPDPSLTANECPACYRAVHSAKWQRAWGIGVTATDAPPPFVAPPEKKKSLPCRHLGDELTAAERETRRLDHLRKWTFCLHVDKPLGEAACGCRGCGPNCRGYVADDDAEKSMKTADDPSSASVQ